MAAVASAANEHFVERLRGKVAASPEFRALAAQLYAEVRSSIRADGLQSFGDLSPDEQQVLVRRARDTLSRGAVYNACREATWRALDTALDAEADDRITKQAEPPASEATQGANKMDTIVQLAASGATSLLSRWPNQHESLLWLLNAELTPPLRLMLWRLKLRTLALPPCMFQLFGNWRVPVSDRTHAGAARAATGPLTSTSQELSLLGLATASEHTCGCYVIHARRMDCISVVSGAIAAACRVLAYIRVFGQVRLKRAERSRPS
eukprot:61167-Pleurochrysis_carterae.AAC.1